MLIMRCLHIRHGQSVLLSEPLGSEAARQVRVFVGFDDWVRARVAGDR